MWYIHIIYIDIHLFHNLIIIINYLIVLIIKSHLTSKYHLFSRSAQTIAPQSNFIIIFSDIVVSISLSLIKTSLFVWIPSTHRRRVRRWREPYHELEQNQVLWSRLLRPRERSPRDSGSSSRIWDLRNFCDLSNLCDHRRDHRRPVRRSSVEVSVNVVVHAPLIQKAS